MQTHVDIVAGGVGIGADLVRGVDELAGLFRFDTVGLDMDVDVDRIAAFGALTGGMDAADPAILAAMQPARSVDAVLGVQGRLVQFPLWRAV